MNYTHRFPVLLAALLTVASLAPLPARAQGAKPGDKLAGEKKADLCYGCHGIPDYKASFPQVYRVPMLGSQSEKYIAAALTQYRKGERKHPSMHAISVALSDQDIADLSAFYASQPVAAKVPDTAAAPTGAAAELIKRGNCTSCHGANFSKPIDGSYPKLAGQHRDYLYQALVAYQTDNNPQVGRKNPIMMGMARPYTHPELKVIADYLASLPGELSTVQQSRWRWGSADR